MNLTSRECISFSRCLLIKLSAKNEVSSVYFFTNWFLRVNSDMRLFNFLILVKAAESITAKIPKKLEIEEDGGYVGLVVGISNTVAKDYSLIKLLQDRLQDASRALYDATEGMAYLKKIHIVVPRKWDKPTDDDTRRFDINFKGDTKHKILDFCCAHRSKLLEIMTSDSPSDNLHIITVRREKGSYRA